MRRSHLSKHQISKVAEILDEKYPATRLHNIKNPLKEAIFILLTSQTNEEKYLRTWRRFQKRFPTFKHIVNANESQIFFQIREGGLGQWKARRIKNLVRTVKRMTGQYSLASLSVLDDGTLERQLMKLDGIGLKSARCIMIYSYGRDVFPIDTHVTRIIKRLGFKILTASSRSKKYADYIQRQIPVGMRARLHITLILHGRQVCRIKPRCAICCIRNYCNHFKSTRI